MESCGVRKLVMVMMVAMVLVRANCDDADGEVLKHDKKLCFSVCLATCSNGFSPTCIPACKRQCDLSVVDVLSHAAADILDADPESADRKATQAPAPAPKMPPSDGEN